MYWIFKNVGYFYPMLHCIILIYCGREGRVNFHDILWSESSLYILFLYLTVQEKMCIYHGNFYILHHVCLHICSFKIRSNFLKK